MLALHQDRRRRLLAQLPPNSVVLLCAPPVKLRNGDVDYPYRPQSDFYYLTACDESEAIAALISDKAKSEFILFNRGRDPVREQWEGASLGQEGAKTELGANQAYPINQFQQCLGELLANKQSVYCLFNDRVLMRKIQKALANLKKAVRSGVQVPTELHDLGPLVHEMRLLKDEHEIELMRRAASISAKAYLSVMRACRAGMHEYELQALIEYEFARQGCCSVAYPSIVAGGANACILHYTANTDELKNGDLLLIDAGGEYQNYAADITRTFPVSGKFGAEQRAIYELVLHVQEKVIESIKPGVTRDVMQTISEKETTQGLIELGILKGNLADLLEAKAFLPFYMHRIGHWLGLDVHDVGAYKLKNKWRPLEPGMVLTIEPGIYIKADEESVEPRWRGIGVRIEDDILVTQDSYEILSVAAPKSVSDIEKIMAEK